MSAIKTIIIDDTPLAVEKLEAFVGQIPMLEHVQSFNKALDGLLYLQRNSVDLVFLDIQMEQFSGLQFLKALSAHPHIIIVSAYNQYAVEGFEHEVVDYLLKPYSFERFLKAVDKVISKQKSLKAKDYMFVKTEYRMERVDFCDILYVVSKGAYLQIVTKYEKKVMTLMNFEELLSHLPNDNFIRIHRSYVIAIDKIESVERNVIMIKNKRISIGKNYLSNFSKNI